MPSLNQEQKQLLTRAKTLGAGILKVRLSDAEMTRLAGVIASDLGLPQFIHTGLSHDELAAGYYRIPLDWFEQNLVEVDFTALFLAFVAEVPDFATYLKCLCEIHKRRKKYAMILQEQPLPHMEQIVPRGLLEFGFRDSEALASWMVWRKWIYDIDNRSAQETGYLFEPILAAAIGGVPFSDKKSPIRRHKNPVKARQVDCIIGDVAYEFKMRVTIAASGQGRFGEELDFALDCEESGYVPRLVVLDPTPSHRLDDLTKKFEEHGGEAYVGDAAWNHIEEQAGEVMSKFIERYVRTPIEEIDGMYETLLPLAMEISQDSIHVCLGDYAFSIPSGEGRYSEANTEEP